MNGNVHVTKCLHDVLGAVEKGGGRIRNQSGLPKEKEQVMHLSRHFLLSRDDCHAESKHQEWVKTAVLLFLNGQCEPYILPALIHHIFISTIMGLLYVPCYYSPESNICNMNELLFSQDWTCMGYLYTRTNHVLKSFDLGSSVGLCVVTLLSQWGESWLWRASELCICKFGSVETQGVQTSNLPGTWCSLEIETMFLASKEMPQRRSLRVSKWIILLHTFL